MMEVIIAVAILTASVAALWIADRKQKEAHASLEVANTVSRQQAERMDEWYRSADNREWMMDILNRIETATRDHMGLPEGDEGQIDLKILPAVIKGIYENEEKEREARDHIAKIYGRIRFEIQNAMERKIELEDLPATIVSMAQDGQRLREENAMLRAQIEYFDNHEIDQKKAEEYADRLSELLTSNIQYSEETETAIREAARMMRR